MRPEESKFVEKLNLSSTEGPKKIKGCVRLWQTDGVHTRLFVSPNGTAVAASGAHNSVQVNRFDARGYYCANCLFAGHSIWDVAKNG